MRNIEGLNDKIAVGTWPGYSRLIMQKDSKSKNLASSLSWLLSFTFAAFLVGGLLFLIGGFEKPAVNRNVFGNPSMEELISECQVSSRSAKIRFYQGDGGATVAFWYSITAQFQEGVERQIFYVYDSPVVESVSCERAQIIVQFANKSTKRFSADDVFAMTSKPIALDRGKVR